MTKSKVGNVKPKRNKTSKAEAQIRDYHALGIMVRDRVTEGRLDIETLLKLIDETGQGADSIRKPRVFAARYTAKQLDEHCKLRTLSGRRCPGGTSASC